MLEAEFVKWLLFALLGTGIWFMKRTLDKIEARQDAADLEIRRVKEEYLHKNDFKDFKSELRGMFEEIKQNIRDLKAH